MIGQFHCGFAVGGRHQLEAIGDEGSLYLERPVARPGARDRAAPRRRAPSGSRSRPPTPTRTSSWTSGARCAARRRRCSAGRTRSRRRARSRRSTPRRSRARPWRCDPFRSKGTDDVKTSLGIWALGAMVTRFVPGRLPARARARDHGGEGAPRGRRPRRPDRRLRVPLPAASSPRTTSTRCATALDGHGIYTIASGLHLDPRFGKGGLVSPDDAIRAEALADHAARPPTSPASVGAHFIVWPGIEGYNYPFQTPVRARAGRWLIDGIGEAAERCAEHGDQALPRAQELRARDEDPHGQHRDDAARHPHAARARGSTTSRSTWTGST